MPMTPERYERLCELFDQAQARPPDQRTAFLEEVGAADPTLRAELEGMLSGDRLARGEQFLQAPLRIDLQTVLPSGDPPTVYEAPPPGAIDDGLVGRRLGPYRIERRVGSGGMGTVYRALREGDYRQQVALKVIRPGLATDEVLGRFRTERQVLAELAHPHIARLLDGGSTDDGRPFFVMEFIDGLPLDRYCERHRLGTPERVRLLLAVCAAVEYAHGHGVLHRDLKPDNVLVTADGTPKVTDFGLAKRLEGGDGGAGPTQSGAVLGTPGYMAPEQAAGRRAAVGPPTDVWALGAILYELLTGRPPFRGETPWDTLRLVLSEEPVPPSRLNARVPRDLETICLKCLQKEPAGRYPTVTALADDLRRFLGGEPIRARPVGRVERLGRWCRRRPGLVATVLGTLLALAGVGYFAHQAHLAEQQRRSEKRQYAEERALLAAMSGDGAGAAEAIREAESLGASPGQTRLLRGQVALHQGEVAAALDHLEEAVRLMPDSVAARASLALAYNYSGQGLRFEQACLELDEMTPDSAEDFLFKALAEGLNRPERALQSLEESIKRRNSILSRSVGAEVRASYALYADDADVAQLALVDAQAAKGMLPGHPVTLARSVNAHLVAAAVFEKQGQVRRSEEALEQARRDAEALKEFPTVPTALMARVHYHEYVGDEDAALALSGIGTEYRRVVLLYRHGDYDKALEAADRATERGNGMARVERGFILAELPDGRDRAWAAFEEAAARDEPGYFRLCTPMIPLLLGRPDEATQASLKVRNNAAAVLPWYEGWYYRYLDYQSGRITEDELLRVAGRCRLKLCEAHLAIGLRHLAEGDRAGAAAHFQESADTRVFIYWDYLWARAFLARMKRDPAWPRWIERRG
jgi:tetratricopeptide (TPR) repeat protein